MVVSSFLKSERLSNNNCVYCEPTSTDSIRSNDEYVTTSVSNICSSCSQRLKEYRRVIKRVLKYKRWEEKRKLTTRKSFCNIIIPRPRNQL